jgi:septal ring factor EnvC (AmiA/AmiB activator)
LRWRGVLINTPQDRDVKAIFDGKVVFADWMRGYGFLIILDHGDGYMSLYGHNNALHRNTGDFVQQGEVIASTGVSGGQLESGVYFELRQGGKPVNPARWLVARR